MSRLFLEKSVKPDNAALQAALGKTYRYWEEIQARLKDEYGEITPEWKYYGAKSGWTLKMLLKKRNLFFFGPCDQYFRIAFVFGDKAVNAIANSGLPQHLIEEVTNARRYAEGRGLPVEVRDSSQIEDIIKLVSIKIKH